MMILKSITVLCILVLIQILGCSTLAPQTKNLLKNNSIQPQFYQINNVPFVDQQAGHCGPATLAMVMRRTGKNVSIEELSQNVYTPGMKGSLQNDMIGASRRQGFVAIPIAGLTALIDEIRSDNPVIVFENLALSWAPQWHYSVVIGYDLIKEEVILHSGHNSFKHIDLQTFERSWKLGDYWGLVVLPPNELAASANEWMHVSAIASLEQLGKMEESKQAYQKILSRWPNSLGALIGLANVAFAQSDLITSVAQLQLATQAHPKSAAAWHNLAIAQGTLGWDSEAHESAHKALSLVNNTTRPTYQQSLLKWLR